MHSATLAGMIQIDRSGHNISGFNGDGRSLTDWGCILQHFGKALARALERGRIS